MKDLYFPYEIDSDSPIPYLFREISDRIDTYQITTFTNKRTGEINKPNIKEQYLPPEGNPWRRRIRFAETSLRHHDLIHTGGRPRRHYRVSKITHARNRSMKHVQTFRVDVQPDSNFGHYSYRKQLAEMADIVTAVSQHTAKTVEEHIGMSPEVVYNGVDTNLFKPNYDRPELFNELDIQMPVVLYVGSFESRKNPDHVVKIAQKMPDVTFLMIGGGGKNHSRLKEETHNDDNIIMTGRIPKELLPPIYANSTAFIFPTIREGCPNVVLEAMASGLPVVGYQATSMPELVEHGKSGYLVDPMQTDKLARVTESLIYDETQQKMSSTARNYILKNHTFEHIAKQYENIYHDLLR